VKKEGIGDVREGTYLPRLNSEVRKGGGREEMSGGGVEADQ